MSLRIGTNSRGLWLFAALLVCILVESTATPNSETPSTGAASPSVRSKRPPIPDSARKRPVFPDEFSDLDEDASVAGEWDPEVTTNLDRARKRYLRALSLVEQKDTALAAEQFEAAISELNNLASYPRIEENLDFTDLVQAVIEDYESYIQNIDNLNENSSVFILRERLFEEIESAKPTVETISVPAPEPPKTLPTTTIPLTYNEFVQKNIEFFASRPVGRKFMRVSLERSGRWFDMIKRIATEENMPPEIAHLAIVESGLSPNALSRVGAMGMWQFMQPTGEEYDLDVTYWVDERRDPEKATRAAMRFLRDLYNDLGDWHLALAAYNCGGGGVRRAIRKSGLEKPDFWQVRPFLPRETQQYVPRFIATSLIAANREQYGFGDDSIKLHTPHEYETVSVTEAVQFSALAQCAGMSIDSLRDLNPELVRKATPPSSAYNLKIRKGAGEEFRKRYAALTDDEKRPFITHKVGRGETLVSIARRYGVSGAELAELNSLSGYKAKLRRGSTLRIPSSSAARQAAEQAAAAETAQAATPAAPTTATQPTPSSATSTKPVATPSEPASTTSASGTTRTHHVVRSGESLTAIARRYLVSLADLRSWNGLTAGTDNIRIGDTLVVSISATPAAREPKVEQLSVTRTIEHRVRKGETLQLLASRYETTVDRIRALNRMKRNSALQLGSTVTIETSLSKRQLAALAEEAERANRPTSYRVKTGDTLTEIAERFGTTIDALKAKNPALRRSPNVRRGQVIKLN
jgi:membrane-bound lytic murein transglycosylase D